MTLVSRRDIYYKLLKVNDNLIHTVSVIHYYSNDESSFVKLIYVVLEKENGND